MNESDCHLAISMHTPFPSQRKELMPAERAFSITEIVDILRNYDFSKQRRLSFEYIVFKDVNDSLVYAKEIVKLLRGIDCRINLIRFHAIPNVNLEGTDMETMVAFRDYLTQHGVLLLFVHQEGRIYLRRAECCRRPNNRKKKVLHYRLLNIIP